MKRTKLKKKKPIKPDQLHKRMKASKAAFLRAFSETGSVTISARLAGIDRTTHYEWLARDAKYKAGVEMAVEMAKGAVFDELVRRGTIGDFQPIVYKGEFQYEIRKRTLCTLEDGTTAFEDELPQGASILQRRTVTTRGEKLGVYKQDGRALWKALVMLMPEMKAPAGRKKFIP